jgi:hypothetical protein
VRLVILMGCVLQDDLKKFVSEPSSPPQEVEIPGSTTLVGTRTDYSVGPWDYPTCAARHLLA